MTTDSNHSIIHLDEVCAVSSSATWGLISASRPLAAPQASLWPTPTPEQLRRQGDVYLSDADVVSGSNVTQTKCLIGMAATAHPNRGPSDDPTLPLTCSATIRIQKTLSTCSLMPVTPTSTAMTTSTKFEPLLFLQPAHRRFQATLKTRSLSCQVARASSRQLRLHSLKNPQ